MTKSQESGIKFISNDDGSFSMEWDSKDPNWKWLNGLTDDQIKVIVEQAIKEYDGKL